MFRIFPLLFLFCFYVHSQDSSSNTFHCPSFSFKLNDTLQYFVHSYDSIVVDDGIPLLKVRNEVWKIICDSVIENVKFRLRTELIDFREKDIEDTNIVEFSKSEWIGRKIWFVVDSTGERYSFQVDDSSRNGRAPGGFFQPHLFFKFSEGCRRKNETWIIRTLDDLPENGIPVPILRHTMLFKMIGEVDTMGEKCYRMEFIRTGQGSANMINPIFPMKVSAIINSYGVLDVSKINKVPFHLFTTVEQRLTLSSELKETKILHYIYSNYTLIEVKRAKESVKKASKKKRGK